MEKPSFFKEYSTIIGFGFLLTFLSSFGQTFLVSLYVPHYQEYFGLSDGLFSSFYAAATLGSAFTLSWLGRFIDKRRLPTFVTAVMLGFALALAILSQAYYIPLLILGLYGIRLFGQGLLTHSSITSMARFFTYNRGKAISWASLGHPTGEAILPIIVVSVIAAVGWRFSLGIWAVMILILVPLVLRFLMYKAPFKLRRLMLPQTAFSAEDERAGKPLSILRSRAFWIVAPTNFASAAIGTAFIFFQLKLGEVRGWSPTWIAASFTAYAIGSALSTLLAGWLTDRYSAQRLFPIYLGPFMVGLVGLYFFDSPWVFTLLVAGIGTTNGFGGTVKNAVLAELYPIAVLGSVRSLFITTMVFSTALGPVVFGFFLDRGLNFRALAFGSFVAMVLFTLNAMRILRMQRKNSAL